MRYILCLLFLPSFASAETFVVSFISMPEKEANRTSHVLKAQLHAQMHSPKDRKSFFKSMDWLKENVRKNDKVVIYLYGHGSTAKGKFKIAAEGGAISASEIKERLAPLPGHVLVVLDSCESAGALAEKWGTIDIICACQIKESAYVGVLSPVLNKSLRQKRLSVSGFAHEVEQGVKCKDQHVKFHLGSEWQLK